MLRCIDHINIVVRDLAGMLQFYCDVLGLVLSKDVTISGPWIEKVVGLKDVEARVVYLELAEGPRIELIEYVSPKGDRPPNLGAPNTHGLRHMAFRVDDIDLAASKLREAGVELFSDVQLVSGEQVTYAGGVRKRLVYFRDPEDNLLELCEYKKQ